MPPPVLIAGFGTRVGARLLDTLIGYGMGLAIEVITLLIVGRGGTVPNSTAVPVALPCFLLGPFLYEWVATVKWGRTVGKRATHIRVVSGAPDLGRPLSPGRSAARAALFPLATSLFAVLGGLLIIVELLVTLTDQPLLRALHDRIAKTVVIRDP